MLGGQARPPVPARLPARLPVCGPGAALPVLGGFSVPCRLPTAPRAGAWEPGSLAPLLAERGLLMDGLILHSDMMPAVFVVCLPLR